MLNFNHKLCKFTQGKCSFQHRLFVLSHYYVACSLHLSGLATHISHYIKLTLFPLTIFYTKIDGPFGSFSSFFLSPCHLLFCALSTLTSSPFLSLYVCALVLLYLLIVLAWLFCGTSKTKDWNRTILLRFFFLSLCFPSLHSTIKFPNNTNKSEWSFVYIYTF